MQIFTLFIRKLAVVTFWFFVWEATARIVANPIVIVGPVEAFGRLFELAATRDFWSNINYSLVRILFGFVLSLGAGVTLAILCSISKIFNTLITPFINVIKSIPVVSFALLAVMLLSPAILSIFIAFITVLPIIFFNTYNGIQNTDKNLLQMAKVFRVNLFKRIRHIYVPTVAPFVVSAAESGLGFAWKAAIAGEVISLASRASIGGAMQTARSFLMTADLYAWTITIVALSFLMEKAFFLLFGRIKKWQ
ncbi:MAG: ABC transporter permease subunit [Clostridiales bacterium]|jgi:NitT/TauT family transport system permease protein|nr:ABC transporter permease subunit [Clostridiales bacterium]